MNIFILFWVKSFSMAHPICPCFKYENIKTKDLVYIFFKMKMKAKTYGINFLVASYLRLNICGRRECFSMVARRRTVQVSGAHSSRSFGMGSLIVS